MSVTRTPPDAAVTGAARKPDRLARRRGSTRKRHSVILNILMTVMLVYALLPLFWLVVNSTKTQANIFETFGFWFARPFALFQMILDRFPKLIMSRLSSSIGWRHSGVLERLLTKSRNNDRL